MSICVKYGMRMIGPNCMGILNTEEGVSLNASFAGATPTPGGAAFLLQSMRSDGIETFFGAATDPQFGRMLAFGLGGVHVEVFKDVVFRLHPLTKTDAEEMVSGIRAKVMLEGARGKPPVNQKELVEVLLRLSRMLSDFPEIEELDLNPFLAGWRGKGSCVLDARVSLNLDLVSKK
ncbi:MAG: acetate--CoA ligase family protein [Planctomycetota bacterium]|nr:acetate--CoA ligase family protein [Planctomycetota bacterium]MDA1113889.1 acetate--CoA ligase family protein [Planctomycetota bacterium]